MAPVASNFAPEAAANSAPEAAAQAALPFAGSPSDSTFQIEAVVQAPSPAKTSIDRLETNATGKVIFKY